MGGIELLLALRSVVERRSDKDINTEVIVITDGEVWQAGDTVEFVRLARAEAKEKVRFFALGIGDAVSYQLVEGIGRQGGGLAEVVAVNVLGGWESRVICMLKAVLTPDVWKIEICLECVSQSSSHDENDIQTRTDRLGGRQPACV